MEESLVDQLVVGHAQEVEGRFLATGSVTLIRTPSVNILVDCGDPWSGDEILQKLASLGLRRDDIHVLVITHGHIDHCGNLSLFKRATIYMDSDIAYDGKYSTLSKDNSLVLSPSVELRRCPGHTDHDLVVIVNDTERGCVVISGDIFECANDDDRWKDVSRYPDLQEKGRSEILGIADWIVPGHGPMFKNQRNHS